MSVVTPIAISFALTRDKAEPTQNRNFIKYSRLKFETLIYYAHDEYLTTHKAI